jgi:A/G-specific adenine glycosylase
VGDYTASAIASICYNEPQAVVDGNVYRVLSRYFGVELPINETEGVKYFRKLAQEVMDTENPRDYNQGIMEFGAMQCTPKNPYCLHCPLQDACVALVKGKTALLPIKTNKTKVRKRYFNYIVPIFTGPRNEKYTSLSQRKGKGIWQGLWEFPLLETEKEVHADYLEHELRSRLEGKNGVVVTLYNDWPVVHKLSHQHLHTKFWIMEEKVFVENAVPISTIEKYPVPVLIADFIKTFKF